MTLYACFKSETLIPSGSALEIVMDRWTLKCYYIVMW